MSKSRFEESGSRGLPKAAKILIPVGIVLLVLAPFATRMYTTVQPGHVAVATLFGKVQPETYAPGLHLPVNPFYSWHHYDTRQKTLKESAGIPSQDQLTTNVDVSVQYRVNGTVVSEMLKNTGTADQAKEVHLIPKLRSLLREQGKSIARAEDFFLKETQERLQQDIRASLQDFLGPKGLDVEDVLIRDISLPNRLVEQIEQKKEAEQQAEREKAQLAQFETKQQQKVKQAEAEKSAAAEEAEMVRLLADARAYEIEKINAALASSPAFIQLEALKALQEMSKDPAAKLYFLNGDSPNPLPLMHMGELPTN